MASLNRPGGNVTGVSVLAWTLSAKRLELLRELLSADTIFGMLVNPNAVAADIETSDR